MDNQTEVSIKFKNYVDGEKKLERYAETLAKIQSITKGIDKGTIKEIESSSQNVKDISKEVKQLNKTTQTAFNYSQIREFSRALERTFKVMSKLATKSADYLENINLFQVAFDGSYQSAEKFVNKLSEMYGLDESWLTRTTGIFKQLSNAMNLSVEQGTKLSTLLTQMSIDISSLYNVDIERASSTLQSALAGQTKPIRATTGADITQNTLQQTMGEIGMDKYVGHLSYAEKRLLIIISLTKQLSESTNDFGRTIESPANQMRILNEQWERLSRAVGNVFMPILAKVLPYLNAILMVLTEIISVIATFLGFSEDDYDYFGGVADSVVDLEESLDGASESAKKLKQGLRGFDKLNVINTPTANSGAGTNIDPKIMDAFNSAFDEYNSKLENVTMKATIIRDKIMEWLGFTKEIDKETGKVSFKFEHMTGGTVLGALAVGGTIYSGIAGIVRMFSKMGRLTLFSGFGDILKVIGKMTGLTGLFKGIGEAFAYLVGGAGTLKEVFSIFILPALKTMGKRLGGIGLIITGIVEAFKGIGKILNGDMFNGISDTLQGISTIVAGIGLFINPVITLIALAVAGVIELVQLIVNNWESISGFLVTAWETFYSTIITPIVDFFTNIATMIWELAIAPIISFFEPIVTAIVDIFTLIFTRITEIVVGVGTAVKSIISKVVEIFSKIIEIFVALGIAFYDYIIQPIFDFFVSAGQWIYEYILNPIFNFFGSIASWIYEHAIVPIMNFFGNIGNWIYNHIIKPIFDWIGWLRDKAVEILKGIGETVVNFISDVFKSVINGVLGAIERGINGFIKMLNGAIGIINAIPGVNITKVSLLEIPRLKRGMDFVPHDYYPAYLDYGERVLTKEENREYMANQQMNNTREANMTQTFNIYVGDEEVASVVLDKLDNIAKSNGKPITIGG